MVELTGQKVKLFKPGSTTGDGMDRNYEIDSALVPSFLKSGYSVVTADKAAADLAQKNNYATGLEQQMQTQATANADAKAAADKAAKEKASLDAANALKQQEIDAKNKLGNDIRTITGTNASDFSSATADINKQQDEIYDKYKSDMDSLRNGTFPLSPEDEASIKYIQQEFEKLKEIQKVRNANYEGGITQLGITSGRARYAGEMEEGNIKKAVDQGISKIADIESAAAKAVSDLKGAIQSRNYDMISKAYESAQKNLARKSQAILDLKNIVNEEAERARQKQADEMAKQEFEMKQRDFASKEEERTGSYIASSLVNLDGDYNVVAPTDAEINEYANESGVSPNVLRGLVNNRIDEVSKMSLEGRKFLYNQQTDLRDYNFDREKFAADQYDKDFNRKLKLDEVQNSNINLSPTQLNDAMKKGYQTEAQLKLYAQIVNGGGVPVVLKEKTPETKKLESNMITGIADIDLLSKKIKEEIGRGKALDGVYKGAESNLIEIISNLKTGAAYSDEQLENFKNLLPKFWQTEKTQQENLERLKNEFIQVLGPDTYNQIKKEQYVDIGTFNQFGTVKEKDEFTNYLKDVGANPNDDVNEYFNIFKQQKGFSDVDGDTNTAVKVSTAVPTGSEGGQCGIFSRKLVDFPSGMGDTLKEKKAFVDKEGMLASQWKKNVRIGDVIFTTESPTYGHVAVVNEVLPDGRVRLSESNYNGDQKVNNNRIISINSPAIYGAVRGKLKV